MDLPITRPSMICYADELEFSDLLMDLSAKKHDGFIRISADSEEGFILFKRGKVIAASYDRHSRVDAIEKIKDAMVDKGTLIETFDVRSSQIDFFMDMNRPYIIGSDAYDLIDELKRSKEVNNKEPAPEPKAVPIPKPVSEAIKESENLSQISETVEEDQDSQTIPDPVLSRINDSNESENLSENKTVKPIQVVDSEIETKPVKDSFPEIIENETIKAPDPEIKPVDDPVSEPVINEPESPVIPSTAQVLSDNLISNPESELNPEIESKEEIENAEMPPMDRSQLMKKYGIREIQDEDVDNIIESYNGGSIRDEDVEKIELTLMNKIKKSILGIPKIRGAEVMVFLDNTDGLGGKVNIIIESESKGFLSRIMGESKDLNLERQIIDISQIEIRKSFRKYPEIVDKFNVNVEIT
jgi:hypothetical protein